MPGDDVPPPPPPTTKIEPNSPYFLGPQDRPGDYITPTHLKGDNYDEWAADIQTALEARRKFEFLDDTITVLESPCTKSDWTAINAMLISWFSNTIDLEIKSSLSKFREVKPFWDHLRKRFAQTNGPRIQQLRSSLARCEQTKTMVVSVYYGKLHALWHELDHHEPLISCTCCSSCTAGRLHEQRRDQSRLHDFLMGLYSGFYSYLRSNILSQDPLPSLDRAYQLAVQEERVHNARQDTEAKPPDALGFAVRANSGRGSVCSHYKKQGHEVSNCWFRSPCPHFKKKGHDPNNCFEIVGYPAGWNAGSKDSTTVQQSKGGGGTCSCYGCRGLP
ncbi:uncharacterized protein LOC110703590 [Chenopodium quinoa]|uniref:uncharacterized protein LOC110703590 n=1 Tax=Chenopodium quinoa TaxID=63459 RepID=UPI000B7867E6|nr:uncharacterized protein LOC110703590 [Chenopodium quinoa]